MRVSCIQNRVYNCQCQPRFKKGESTGELKAILSATRDQIRKKTQDIHHECFPNASMKEVAEAGNRALSDSDFLVGIGRSSACDFRLDRQRIQKLKGELLELDQFAQRLKRDLSIEESNVAIDASARLVAKSASASGQPLSQTSLNELYANAERQKQDETLRILLRSNPDTAIYL